MKKHPNRALFPFFLSSMKHTFGCFSICMQCVCISRCLLPSLPFNGYSNNAYNFYWSNAALRPSNWVWAHATINALYCVVQWLSDKNDVSAGFMNFKQWHQRCWARFSFFRCRSELNGVLSSWSHFEEGKLLHQSHNVLGAVDVWLVLFGSQDNNVQLSVDRMPANAAIQTLTRSSFFRLIRLHSLMRCLFVVINEKNYAIVQFTIAITGSLRLTPPSPSCSLAPFQSNRFPLQLSFRLVAYFIQTMNGAPSLKVFPSKMKHEWLCLANKAMREKNYTKLIFLHTINGDALSSHRQVRTFVTWNSIKTVFSLWFLFLSNMLSSWVYI